MNKILIQELELKYWWKKMQTNQGNMTFYRQFVISWLVLQPLNFSEITPMLCCIQLKGTNVTLVTFLFKKLSYLHLSLKWSFITEIGLNILNIYILNWSFTYKVQRKFKKTTLKWRSRMILRLIPFYFLNHCT